MNKKFRSTATNYEQLALSSFDNNGIAQTVVLNRRAVAPLGALK